MRLLLAALLLLAPSLTFADVDAARLRYEAGAALYEATRYEAALREFEAAQAMEPRPALVYNIARCLDRLGRRQEAATAYERFLRGEEAIGAHADEARLRLAELARMPAPTPSTVAPSSPPPTKRRRYLGPGILVGGALALAIIGAGLTGSALADYNQLSSSCAPNCQSSTWQGLPARERAGEALLGIAGAALVADVVWFVIVARRK